MGCPDEGGSDKLVLELFDGREALPAGGARIRPHAGRRHVSRPRASADTPSGLFLGQICRVQCEVAMPRRAPAASDASTGGRAAAPSTSTVGARPTTRRPRRGPGLPAAVGRVLGAGRQMRGRVALDEHLFQRRDAVLEEFDVRRRGGRPPWWRPCAPALRRAASRTARPPARRSRPSRRRSTAGVSGASTSPARGALLRAAARRALGRERRRQHREAVDARSRGPRRPREDAPQRRRGVFVGHVRTGRRRFGGARERGRSEPAAREPSDGERCSMRRIWQRSSGRSRWKSACWNSDQPDWPLACESFRLRVLRKP